MSAHGCSVDHVSSLDAQDLLNHVIDDIEMFVRVLYEMTGARRELEKRRSLKRKKTDRK